jgi:hypothetical protein
MIAAQAPDISTARRVNFAMVLLPYSALRVNQDLETAVDHALDVEGHRPRSLVFANGGSFITLRG